MHEFLGDRPSRGAWSRPEQGHEAFEPQAYWLGDDPQGYALEVVLARGPSRPSRTAIRALWRDRQAHRPSPVLLVVQHGTESVGTVCGVIGDDPSVWGPLPLELIGRMARLGLDEPDRRLAIRLLTQMLPEADGPLPGIRNAGLLATHQLKDGVPARADWASRCAEATPLCRLEGRALVEALQFDVEPHAQQASLLRVQGTSRAVAIFLDRNESFDVGSTRFSGDSPVTYALAQADANNVPYVVVARGSQIRLYASDPTIGVGRKGRADTFLEINAALLTAQTAGYLPLLVGAGALAEQGSLEQLFEASHRYAAALSARLRDRVYSEAVPRLATAVAEAQDTGMSMSDGELSSCYEQALLILFRLVFVAYAEDRDLLPYSTNGAYRDHSLKRMATHLTETVSDDAPTFDGKAYSYWDDVRQLWDAVDRGNADWGVPAYNGGLFSSDPDVRQAGAALATIRLSNAHMGPVLAALLLDYTPEGIGPVDFRSLSVREFGTIYEGLLESQLAVALDDLTLDKKDVYVPAGDDDVVVVSKGSIYLQNRSGARKSSGTYFTKPFAVEHLLAQALEPALDAHLARITALLDAGDEASATEAFFDFRCADIAMGSGHFLIAAIDRIERRFSNFLADHPIAGITAELERLRQAAAEALGGLADAYEIESSSLLRRQIARRCIYGVDVNALSVELARVSVWIHTFVPGLPLSFLSHGLVHGNSLAGIGTVDEAVDGLGGLPLFRAGILKALEEGTNTLARLSQLTEADHREIETMRVEHAQVMQEIAPVERLLDICVAARTGVVEVPLEFNPKTILGTAYSERAEQHARDLQALHFPVAFPEVFARERAGFDCIVGNPPWEKLIDKPDSWWAIRFPGLNSLSVGAMNKQIARLRLKHPDLAAGEQRDSSYTEFLRQVLMEGPYPELGASHPDLYKAFCWRFLALVSDGGRIGVVLPRSAISASGTALWREAVLEAGSFADVITGTNTAGWIFDAAEHRYTIAFTTIARGDNTGTVNLRGPAATLMEFHGFAQQEPASLTKGELESWTSGLAFPLLPDRTSGEIFRKMHESPQIKNHPDFEFQLVLGDFNATTGKRHMVLEPADTEGLWPVYGGSAFNLWQPDTGKYYGWADPEHVTKVLYDKRLRQHRTKASAFSTMPSEWIQDEATLPCLKPRIAFRLVTNRTNRRTLITSLLPPEVIVHNGAPYLLFADERAFEMLVLLGVLSSIPLDWAARRIIELNVNNHVFNTLPIPSRDTHLWPQIASLAAALVAEDVRFEEWIRTEDVGFAKCTAATDRSDLIHRIDALVAHAYGLEEDELIHIFETFHRGWDYQPRLEAVLDHFSGVEG